MPSSLYIGSAKQERYHCTGKVVENTDVSLAEFRSTATADVQLQKNIKAEHKDTEPNAELEKSKEQMAIRPHESMEPSYS